MMYSAQDGMIARLESMFATVTDEGHGSVLLVFVLGIVFGSIIQYTKVHKFEKIAGFSVLKDTVVPKMLFLAIGLASIMLYFMVKMGYASYHIKPMILGGLIIGGTIFGASMAIFGKCPGTGPVSVAEGRIDIMVGAFGGILGGLFFTLFYEPIFKPLMGPNMGKLSILNTWSDSPVVILIFGIALVAVSVAIPLVEEIDNDDIGYKE